MDRHSLYFTDPRELDRRSNTFEAAADEVVVETRVSAISAGTELLIYRGEVPTDIPADPTIDSLDTDLSFPLRYGYAAVGEVVSTGDAVAEEWLGRTVFGFNPHETAFAAAPDTLIPVPEDLDPEIAALLPSVETATSLVLDGRPRLGERTVVFGAGVIGLCTIGILGTFPLDELVAVDPIATRREHAARMGADVVVSPEDVSSVVGEWDEDGADIVYELSGQPAALDDAVSVTGYDGRVIVGSWYGTKRPTLDLGTEFHRGRISIESSQVSTLSPEHRGRFTRDRRTHIALDRLMALDVSALITHRIPFADAQAAYTRLDEHDALQILLTYS